MRALRTDGQRVHLDGQTPAPTTGATDALIRVSLAAISRRDHEAARPGSGFVGTLGSEFVGVVERVGVAESAAKAKPGAARAAESAGVAPLVGKRVVASALICCGVCDLCTRGLAWHCRDSKAAGSRGRDGCFAERVALPAANLVVVPDGVKDEAAVFAVAIAQALHNAQHASAGLHSRGSKGGAAASGQRGAFVTVVGDGPIGLLTAQALARQSHAVRVLGRHEHKMALCEKWGVNARHERDAGRRADQDVVIDCSGTPDGFAMACAMVRPRGRVVLCSRFAPAAVDLRPLAEQEIELAGSRGGSVGEAMAMLRSGGVDTTSLVGRRFKLDEAVDAMRAAGEPEMLRALLSV